jgi:hypothetical protein
MAIFDKIASLFSGGAGSVIESVTKAVDTFVTTDKEKEALKQELLKIQNQYNIEMETLSQQAQKMYIDDTASARAMNTSIETSIASSWLSKNITPALAISTTVLGFILFYIFSFKSVPQISQNIIMYILGGVSSMMVQIFSFYFGSSKGSETKQNTIDTLVKNQ